jgi:hypothetical protein
VAGQAKFERFSYSRRWIFPRAVAVWRDLVLSHGLRAAIVRWEHILSSPLLIARCVADLSKQLCFGG